MASLPSPTQVSGKHNAIYEAYYKQVDPKGIGTIEAMDAAKFLKKSGLSDVVLSRIWDLSDPKGRGYLDKSGLFVALKLVALAQHGHDINMRNILMEPPNPPKVGEIPKIMPQAIQSIPASNTDWSMKPTDRLKYEQLFDSLQPVNGLIAGNKVKGVLMDSKLPLDTLGRIWDLADQDKDGSLDKHEFTVAMHLVYQALDKRAVPTTLPPELKKSHKPSVIAIPRAPSGEGFGDSIGGGGGGFVANFPKDIAPPPQPPVMMPSLTSTNNITSSSLSNLSKSSTNSNISVTDWVVTPQDRKRFEGIFLDCDKDKDGLVSGLEVKNVFLQSGVPQLCLAKIWALCDTNLSGKLTLEQFALAMWMVEQKKKGIEPPETLTPKMIPPSLRSLVPAIDQISLIQSEPPKPKYSNPELEMVSTEIDELVKEKRLLETDIAQKEADIRIKTGEIRSLQSELDTLAATLKQLENQKGEAQKRLDDLTNQVARIREQCLKQEETINEQEGELNSKKSELQKLKDEEAALEKEHEILRKDVENLSTNLQDKQFQISQIKAMITQLLESQRQMNDAVLLCKAAMESHDAYLVSDYSLKIEPDFHEAKETLVKVNEQPSKASDPFNDENTAVTANQSDDGFGGKDAFASSNGFTTDPFNNDKKVKSVFDDSFMNAPLSGFDDAFSGSSFSTNQSKDPFSSSNSDPFGDKKTTMSSTNEPGKDDFGSDPFAILHAPTGSGQILSPNPPGIQKSVPPPRPESPSPALPPKKSKQPPPRPAPPRPLQGPTRPAPPTSTVTDSFGSSSSSGFADFADFDNKQSTLLPPSPKASYSSLIKTTSGSTESSFSSKINRLTTTTTTGFSTQQIETVKSNQKALGTTKDNKKILDNSKTSTLTQPTDFVEDPFKDYRYEDVFDIKDPFTDDDDDNVNNNNNIGNGRIRSKKDQSKNNGKGTSFKESFYDDDSINKKDFFEEFDDNFKKFMNKDVQKNTNDSSNAFTAFGDDGNDNITSLSSTSNITEKATSKKKPGSTFSEFEDDFNKIVLMHSYDNNNNDDDKTAETSKTMVQNTKKKSRIYDLFSEKKTDSITTNKSNNKSKDSFENDLQTAIQKSLIEQ